MINDFTKKEAPVLSTLGLGGGNASRLLLGSSGDFVISRSLRFNKDNYTHMQRTPSSAGSLTTWTLSFWVKRGRLSGGTEQEIFNVGTAANNYFGLRFSGSDQITVFDRPSSGNVGQLTTTAVYRDIFSWYHIVYTWDTTNSTQDDRKRLYVNGSRVTEFDTNQAITSSGTESRWNSTLIHTIGQFDPNGTIQFDGFLADVNFVDGSSLEPTSFGEYDTSGVWQAKRFAGAYGSNGFRLKFDDNTSMSALGADSSGNGNSFSSVYNLLPKTGIYLDDLVLVKLP